jgi:hypothetical protein
LREARSLRLQAAGWRSAASRARWGHFRRNKKAASSDDEIHGNLRHPDHHRACQMARSRLNCREEYEMDAKRKPRSGDVLKEIIPPLTAWAVGKLLDRPRVKRALERIDRVAQTRETRVARVARTVRRSAAANRTWIAVGAAAVAVGIGLMARAARRK